MERKKIVLVTDAWRPQINGVVVCIEALIPILSERGYDVEVLHPGKYFSVPMPLYTEIRLAFFARKKIRAELDASRADHIHLMTEGPLGWYARNWCVKNGIPFTTSYHTQFALYAGAWLGPVFSPAVMKGMKRFHSPATRTMVAGEDLVEELSSYGFEHLALWPLGVDAKRFTHQDLDKVPHFKKPIFAYVGRVSPEKNIEEFLASELPGTKLVIGDGPDKKKLQRRYRGEAVFVGFKKGVELVQWLSLADVMVFPSRTDTFGLVILEALACGVPVAAHDVIGPRGIITSGKDGVLGENLSLAAQEALALSPEECRKTALRYSWEASAEAFISNLVQIEPRV
jgi:glycosyltransferase involved in cell wall biosynthesis